MVVDRHFQQWGIDIVGPINPSSSLQHKYIITTTDYFTRWSEAEPMRVVNTNQVLQFLETNIITRFGVPESLVFDNASYFSSRELTEFALEKGIRIRYSANYYPQGNGLAESTNKNLLKILKRSIAKHHMNWHTVLHQALWAYRVTPKSSICNSPFFFYME